jgi:hypothetical protein
MSDLAQVSPTYERTTNRPRRDKRSLESEWIGPDASARTPVLLCECRNLITEHARKRMKQRQIRDAAVFAALDFGRCVHVRGAVIYAIGRKEVKKFAYEGIDLSEHAGVQVVCTTTGAVLTVYRNQDFRGIRTRGRRPAGRRIIRRHQ